MNLTSRFDLGQPVWVARAHWGQVYETCPECSGLGTWTVTKPDGSSFEADCNRCSTGYLPATGKIGVWKYTPKAEPLTVGQVRIEAEANETRVAYMCNETGVGSGSVWREDRLFEDYDAAMARAVDLCAETKAEADAQEALRRKHEVKRLRKKAAKSTL